MSKKLFAELRRLAEETRNRKLEEVRAEYGQTIADIAAMEQRLIGKPVAVRPKSKADEKLVDLIAALMPLDRTVTVDDVQGLLHEADPTRNPNIQTIRATMHRLAKEGAIKKISNPQHGQKVQYCLPGFEAEPVRSLADWAEQILREAGKPLQVVEIMVRMTEAGFEMECDPQQAVRNLERAINGLPSQFENKNGTYACFIG